MKLHTLILDNFQGLRHFEHNFSGQNTSVFGDNATGKTTLFNAITWLLFGTSSTGAKGFSPKTVDSNGEVHGLEHSVEATMEFDNGDRIPLKKVFKEIWRTKRGSLTEEFSGHTTEFYINGVPVKEKDFADRLPDADKMKLLTVPWYFSEGISWQERRNVLLEMGDKVSDEDVMTVPELKNLPKILSNFALTNNLSKITVDEYRKVATARRQLLNRSLDSLPGRIDEATKAIPADAPTDRAASKAYTNSMAGKLDAINQQIESMQKERAEIAARKSDGLIAEQIAALRSKQQDIKLQASRKYQAEYEKWLEEDKTYRNQETELLNRVYQLKTSVEDQLRLIKKLEVRREQLLDEYHAEAAKSWDRSKEVCPSCNRPLPSDQIENLYEEFNLAKSKKLEVINKRGCEEASAAKIKTENEKLAALQAKLSEALLSDIAFKAKAKSQLPERPIAENLPAYIEIDKQIKTLRANEDTGEAVRLALTEVNVRISELQADASKIGRLIADATVAMKQVERIEELETERKQTAVEYEQLDLGLRLCEIFVKTKMDMLSVAVNKRFKSVSFRLFVEQINGGVKEDCEVLVPGPSGQMVSYQFANNAARINAGLEIIGALSKHYGLSMVVFVDNAEAVTKLADTDFQLIRLIVSEADKALRIA